MKRAMNAIAFVTIMALLFAVGGGSLAKPSTKYEIPLEKFKIIALDYEPSFVKGPVPTPGIIRDYTFKREITAGPLPSGAVPQPSPKSIPKPTPAPKVSSGWVWPVTGKLSGYFSGRHPALDIARNCGTAVRNSKTGKVIFAGWKNNNGGYQVWIDSGKYAAGYYHLSKIYVGRGQTIAAGVAIGAVGSTGHSTGCHLHFEIWVGTMWNGGYRVNPLKYL